MLHHHVCCNEKKKYDRAPDKQTISISMYPTKTAGMSMGCRKYIQSTHIRPFVPRECRHKKKKEKKKQKIGDWETSHYADYFCNGSSKLYST